MRVSHVALDDYRSYRHAVIEFPPGITVLVGANGQGKTNVVEAIAYLSAFSSHRVSAEAALVRVPASDEAPVGGAVIRVKLVRGEADEVMPVREHVIELEIVRGQANRALLNRTQVRPRDIVGMVRTVVFAPEDLQLVRSDPAVRRAFLDDLVIQSQPVMVGVKADFDKVARQRAAVLKSAQSTVRRGYAPQVEMLEIWDQQFAALSARITAQRHAMVEALMAPTIDAYDRVADSPKRVGMTLAASVDGVPCESVPPMEDVEAQTARLLEALRSVRDKEIERGVNLVGAHRDDLNLTLGGLPVKGYASHGESWSVALALKLAAFEVLTEGSEEPILILDDVFAELDARRRKGLSAMIRDAQQVLITAAVEDDVPTELQGATIYVRADADKGSVVSTTPWPTGETTNNAAPSTRDVVSGDNPAQAGSVSPGCDVDAVGDEATGG